MEQITSRQNELLRQVRKLYSSRSARRETGLFVCDGFKLLEEASLWGAEIPALLLREDRAEDPRAAAVTAGRKAVLPAGLFDSLCDVQTSPGVLFLCRMPAEKEPDLTRGCLVLDGLQDPGNLGTILRTADALGVASVCLTEGCVDPYNPKCVRATMGALFRAPFFQMEKEELLRRCRRQQVPVITADLRPGAKDLRKAELHGAAVVIGSEGPGVSEFFRSEADGSVIIPMRPGRESLNAAVAASIIAWELTRD